MIDGVNQGTQDLWPDIAVNTTWYIILRGMILNGIIAEIGEGAFAVYNVIKAHTDLGSGRSFPSRKTIAELIGKSEDTVDRYLQTLYQHKLLNCDKSGRHNIYTINEKIPMLNSNNGELVATAGAVYNPRLFQGILDDIQQFAKSGIKPEGFNGDIHVHINVVNARDNVTINYGVSDTAPKVKAALPHKLRNI